MAVVVEDLESFLDTQTVDSDDDQQLCSIPRRTVDEILLLHDSSSSSSAGSHSPSSPPAVAAVSATWYRSSSSSSSSSFYRPQLLQRHHGHDDNVANYINNDVITQVDFPESQRQPLSLSQSQSRSLSLDSKFNNSSPITTTNTTTASWVKSPDFPSSRSTSPLLHPLFAAVRSNAKPGAALAAAAAASRSIPTPHAAAIKSSRTSTAAAPFRVLDDSKRSSSSSSAADRDSELSCNSAVRVSDDKWDNFESTRGIEEIHNTDNANLHFSSAGEGDRVQDEDLDDRAGAFLSTQTPQIDAADSFLSPKVDEQTTHSSGEVSSTYSTAVHFDSPSQIEKDSNFDEHFAPPSVMMESEGQQFQSSSSDKDYITEDSQFNSAQVTAEKGITAVSNYDDRKNFHDDEAVKTAKMHDLDNVISHYKDDVVYRGEVIAEVVQDVSLCWEGKKSNRKTPKKSEPSLRPLELAEELEKKQAFTGLHLEEGAAAAQPMRLEGVRRGSTVLGYFDVDANNVITGTLSSQAFRREHGIPMVLAVHLTCISVGMSKGVIIVTPSKYSPYHADNMDAKMSMLGLQGDRSNVAVTSMCFNQQGDLLFAGYDDGHCTVWDVFKASPLKVITEHKSPVVHMLYLGQDSQVTRQFNLVTGDSKLVNLIRFSVVPWVNRISYSKPTKLFDVTTSTVICAAPLLSGDYHGGAPVASQGSSTVSTSAIGSMMGGVIGGDSGWRNSSLVDDGVVIFVTHQTALVAKVSPTFDYCGRIDKPDGAGEGLMPYAAWKYMSDSNLSSTEISKKFALLAIAWGQKVHVAKLVKTELKVYGEWTLDSPAVGLAWLDDQMLVVLTSVGQLCLFAKDGNMIHQTSFAIDGSRGDDLISYHTYFHNIYGNPVKAHHNCLSVRGASIYVLGPSHLVVSRLLPWKERIEVLRRVGDWMGALNMAMALFDGEAHGVIDLPRALHDIQRTIMPYLAELLLSYVDEVFSYIKVASGNQVGISDQLDESKSRSGFDHPDIKKQYIRVGGVAVEFCVHIKRTDILFDEISSMFYAAKNKETFLELLEPYILKDMLGSLPPAIMQALVEHYSVKGWLQRVEQCVLHMDISSLDFNQVVRLCREHRLYGALIYLFNKGLDDFRTPLEELLVILQNSQRETATELGYRMLVYLKYCFQGLAFPPGQGTLSPNRLPYIRKELLQFLLEDSSSPNSRAVTNLPSKGQRRPNLCHLLELDTEATLEVLGYAFEDDEILILYLSEASNSAVDPTEVEDLGLESQNLVQELVDVLSVILDMSSFQGGCSTSGGGDSSLETWPSKRDAGHIFEFIAHYVSCQRAQVSRDILSHILEFLTSEISLSPSQTTNEASKLREKQVLALLDVVPEADWDAPYLLHLCEKSQFHKVCGFIHSIRHQHLASLDSYMKAVDEPIHAFSFIHYMLQHLNDRESESDAFRTEVISRVPSLVKLSREGTLFLVLQNFNEQSQHNLLSELQSQPEILFLYLKTLIEVHSTGNLDFSGLRKGGGLDNSSGKDARHHSDKVKAYLEALTDFPKILHKNPIHVTDEITELYFELLCRYEQKSVLKFLETFESYRVENCLRLCQEHGIVDGAVFLLERVGEVGSALLLILSGLNAKFFMLDAAIASEPSDFVPEHFSIVLNKKEVKNILDIVYSCIGLCQRNSPRLDSHESEHLWIRLLDSFCEPLVDSCSNETRLIVETHIEILDYSVHKEEDEEACNIQWKISKFHKHAHVLRKLLSLFIKDILEGMLGYVRLPTIMLKLLSDNGDQEFGDFKLTILGMLGTYDFERRILDTAKSLIEDDTYYTMSLLKKGALHGYAPRSLLCCVCNCLLTKSSQSSSIRVFSCGHATHVHCEVQEHETLVGGSSSGCPICAARKNTQRSRSKSVLVENRLMSKASSRSHQIPGAVLMHTPDNDVFQSSYGAHPIPRFELLNNLQKDQRPMQIENLPQLRLAPPALYHEKVKKGIDIGTGESSNGSSKAERSSRSAHLRDVKVKGSSVRFPLRSNIFGKQKKSKQ